MNEGIRVIVAGDEVRILSTGKVGRVLGVVFEFARSYYRLDIDGYEYQAEPDDVELVNP